MRRNTEHEAAALERAAASSYWTEAEARVVLQAQESSGQSLTQFARQHGLTPQRLRWWKGRLGQPGAALTFLPVQVAAPQPAQQPVAPGPGALMEVVLATGRRVRVAPGFDEAALLRLVRALEGTC